MLPPFPNDDNGGDNAGANQEPGVEIRSAPNGKCAETGVDCGHDYDENNDGDELKHKLAHAQHHASVSDRPKAAEIGLEFAAFNGATVAEPTHTYDNALGIIVRLIDADATSPADALALVAAAQTLMPQDNESDALILANALTLRAMRALEHLSSTPARVFNGSGPTLN